MARRKKKRRNPDEGMGAIATASAPSSSGESPWWSSPWVVGGGLAALLSYGAYRLWTFEPKILPLGDPQHAVPQDAVVVQLTPEQQYAAYVQRYSQPANVQMAAPTPKHFMGMSGIERGSAMIGQRMNGIPTVALPPESAARTHMAQRFRPQLPPTAQQMQQMSGLGGGSQAGETFGGDGGGEGALGGERF